MIDDKKRVNVMGASAALFACLQSAVAAVCVDGAIPGGNGRVVNSDGDRCVVEYEMRDTDGWWFRCCFAVRGAQGRTLSFELRSDKFGIGDGAVGDYGPAVSHDGGRTWGYEPCVRRGRHGFEYRFGPDDTDVRFAQCLQYDPGHWRAFLDAHKNESIFREETLAVSSRGKRQVPLVRFGNLSSPKYRLLFTSRHHANEATATYVIEGIAAQAFAQDALGEWIRKNVQMIVVPFVDFDGVVDGDQGKNRIPRDHNRDYHPSREPIYAEIAAIERIVRDERPDVVMDFHNPAIHSVGRLFQTGLPNPEDAERQRSFALTLERIQKGAFTYLASDDVPFGVRWNSAANYEKGQTLEHFAADVLRENGSLVTLWEVPFATAHGGRLLSGDDFRALGRDIAEAFSVYCRRMEPDSARQADSVRSTLPQAASFGEVEVCGELRTRIERNLARFEDGRYAPDAVFMSPVDKEDKYGWPGDMEGRTILALVLGSQAAGREFPRLADIMRRVPGWLNAKGYMGPVNDDRIDEQQLSGNGWMLRALCEYAEWRKDRKMDAVIRRMAASLFLPWQGEFAKYPITPDGRAKGVGEASGSFASQIGRWRLSTDIGCVFIGMDGLAHAYAHLRDEAFRPVLDEMVARFLEMDMVAIRAQTHASLTAMRGVLRYADAAGRRELVAEVVRRFDIYRSRGMTESYANYNWFCRYDTWTEPCAIVDSYMLAVELWRHTRNADYLELADRIYLNALCRAQRANGGFGLENCPGSAAKTDSLAVCAPEAYWCCSMRGGEGLARAAQHTAFCCSNDVYVAFYRNARTRVHLASGDFSIEESYSVPLGNVVKVKVAENSAGLVGLHFRKGDWMESVALSVNGSAVEPVEEYGFLRVSRRFMPGDEIVLAFDRRRRWAPVQNVANAAGMRRAFYGPLLLGADGEAAGLDEMKPVYHLLDPSIWEKGSGRIRILFDEVRTAPAKRSMPL